MAWYTLNTIVHIHLSVNINVILFPLTHLASIRSIGAQASRIVALYFGITEKSSMKRTKETREFYLVELF